MDTPADAPARPIGRRREIALAVGLNLLFVAGVVFGGWPAGNVLLLFWVENVVLGAWTLVRILSAQVEPHTRRPFFFVGHYGMFCLVHLVFVAILSFWMGAELTVAALVVPTVLVAVRHAADVVTVWFGAGVFRRATPTQAFVTPYPRMAMLHVTTILAWGLMIGLMTGRRMGQGPTGLAGVVAAAQDALGRWGVELTPAGLVVLLLVAVKLFAEVFLAGRPITWEIGTLKATMT